MPVSNHGKNIATTKSGHIARAFPASDVCWDAPHLSIVPGDNYIDTAHLGSGKTTKTLIHDANVWTAAGKIDAAPSDPAHAGVGGGLVSGTYRKEAAPTSYSQDVKFEGNGVVRTMDSTTQNHANTSGLVDGASVSGTVDNGANYLKKKCTIDTLVGQCKHGRPLGAPPNGKGDEAFFLDVLGDDKVTLTTTRKDLTANTKADCAAHTDWVATRAGLVFTSQLRGTGDTFVVVGAVMNDPWNSIAGAYLTNSDQGNAGVSLANKAKAPKNPDQQRWDKDTEATQKALAQYGGGGWQSMPAQSGKGNFQSQDAPTGPGVVQPIADKKWAEYNKKLDDAVNKRAASAAIQDIGKAIAFWMIDREPPVVNVTALACGGAKHVMVRVFPQYPVDFDLFSEALNAKFKLIRDISKVVEYISGKFGFSFELKFLENPNFKLTVQYKELTEDKNTFSKSQVRKAWKLTFAFDPFFQVGCKFTAPLLPLMANIASPAVAEVVKVILDKAGIQINFFAEVKLKLIPSISAVYDEYDEGSVTGPMCKLDIVFSIGAEAKISDWGAAEIRGYLDGVLQLEKWVKAPKPALVQADLTGYIQIGISGFVKASKWGFEVVNLSFDWHPNQLRFPPKDANGGGGTYKITTFQLTVR
jgi:hypothetical protein